MVLLLVCVAAVGACGPRDASPRPPANVEIAAEVFPPPPPKVPKVEYGPLQVVRANPRGDKDVVEAVSVTFDQPFVPLASLATLDEVPPPLHIEPPVKGRFRWLGASTVSFVPLEPLPPATTYTVTVPQGTTGALGQPMESEYRWSFTTRLPKVVSVVPSQYEKLAQPNTRITLRFNQPIRGDSVEQRLRLTAGGKRIPFVLRHGPRLESSSAKTDKRDRDLAPNTVEIVPAKPLPLDSRVEVQLAAGFLGSEGQLPAKESFGSGFSTYGPLRVGQPRCNQDPCNVMYGMSILLTTPVPPEAKALIKIRPALPEGVELHVSGTNVSAWGRLGPRTRYTVTFDGRLTDIFGQKLGRTVTRSFRTGDFAPHMALDGPIAATEALGPAVVPLQTVNITSAKRRAIALSPELVGRAVDWVEGPARRRSWDRTWEPSLPSFAKDANSTVVRLKSPLNRPTTQLLPIGAGKRGQGTWLVSLSADVKRDNWVRYKRHTATVVSATDIGLQAWYDDNRVILWVTRLADAQPAPDTPVAIFTRAGYRLWKGTTDDRGIATAPGAADLGAKGPYYFTAGPDDGFVFVRSNHSRLPGSDWLSSYTRSGEPGADKRLFGSVFSERGIYRPGETVEVKGVLRLVDRNGVDLLPGSVKEVDVLVTDAFGGTVIEKRVPLTPQSTFHLRVPTLATGRQGHHRIRVEPVGMARVTPDYVGGSFRVESYRAPEFSVSAQLEEDTLFVGDTLEATVAGDYLFGAPMRGRDVNWYLFSEAHWFSPPGHRGWSFDSGEPSMRGVKQLDSDSVKLDAKGRVVVSRRVAGDWVDLRPRRLRLSAEVVDANRQSVAARAEAVLHPAGAYFGLKTKRRVIKATEPVELELIAARPDGGRVGGLDAAVVLERGQWRVTTKPRDGRLERSWETVWSSVDTCRLQSHVNKTAACRLTPTKGGFYRVVATGKDKKSRPIKSSMSLWVVGPGFTLRDDASVELRADKDTYVPGDTARVLVTSPWPSARALLVKSRLGIVEYEDLGAVGQSRLLEIPLKSSDVPNLHVTVVVTRGRQAPRPAVWADDKGRPASSSARLNLRIEPLQKELDVAVTPSKTRARPGDQIEVALEVTDHAGKPARVEVTVAVVDEGVLSLIGYQTPNPGTVIWRSRPADSAGVGSRGLLAKGEPRAPLQGVEYTSRKAIIDELNRRATEEERASSKGAKGLVRITSNKIEIRDAEPVAPPPSEAPRNESAAKEAGGEGKDAGNARVRSNFATTAYFTANVMTDDAGRAALPLALPDNLTTFRIMAIAVDAEKDDRFGSGESTVTIRQPLLLRTALPRFAVPGDKFESSVTLNNESGQAGTVTVSADADGAGAAIISEATQQRKMAKGGAVEIRFDALVARPGDATFTYRAKFVPDKPGATVEEDAVVGVVPVDVPRTRESVATYGTTEGAVAHELVVPDGVFPEVGGMSVTLSSTMLTNLHDAIDYLIEYPYGCLEQTASRVLPAVVLRELVARYEIAGLDQAAIDQLVAGGIERILDMQRPSGGYTYWPGGGYESYPWPSIYATFVLYQAKERDYAVPQAAFDRAVDYLDRVLRYRQNPDTGHPVGDTTLAFAASVLADIDVTKVTAKRDLVPLTQRRDKLPMFARAFVVMAWTRVLAEGNFADRTHLEALMEDLNDNIVEEAADAHFAEPKVDAYAEYFASDNRTDAIGLMAYLRANPRSDVVPKVARGLMQARVKGRWRTTQENAYALLALSHYAREYEREEPDFVARLWRDDDFLLDAGFQGRSTEAFEKTIPMKKLLDEGDGEVVLAKKGQGRLYYRLGLDYAPRDLDFDARDEGFTIVRSWRTLADASGNPGPSKTGLRKPNKSPEPLPAGSYIQVTVEVVVPVERHWVVVDVPIPAGVEPVNFNLKTSFDAAAKLQPDKYYPDLPFNHRELRDDRVLIFADRVAPGVYEHSFVVRATSLGEFHVAPAIISEMYSPEVFGRTSSGTVSVVAP